MGKLIRVENMNVGKAVHPVIRMPARLPRKQKADQGIGAAFNFVALLLLAFQLAVNPLNGDDFAKLPAMPETPALDFAPASPPISDSWKEGETLVQAYEIWDARYCELTPKPFLCSRCIRSDRQFVRIIDFAGDGPPYRSYECRAFKKPYLY